MNQRLFALGFAGLALVASFAFLMMEGFCGFRSVEERQPGEPLGPSRCESNWNPFSVAYVGFSALGFVAIWRGNRWVALALAIPLLAWGAIDFVGIGFAAFPTGLLMVFASIWDPKAPPRREPSIPSNPE